VAPGESIVKSVKQSLALPIILSLVLATPSVGFTYQTDESTAAAPIQPARQTPEQLQQLVAPIALYPDALVAQILAASTYPTEVVEADRWMQQHPGLKGQQLGEEVDKQDWDPSVKALTQVPSVLANMDKNLSWTSSLGDAYVNQQQQVMNTVQVMRQRAQQAGNLKSTPQEQVMTQGQTIVIEPADSDVVYVPAYDPWLVYGSPLPVWPEWYPVPGIFIGGQAITFGVGFGVGYFGGFGWGWHHWGFDWHNRAVIYNHNTYISHSRTFINRNNFAHHAGDFHPGPATREFGGAEHGFSAPRSQPGTHSGAFSGFDHGGIARSNSFRGHSSFGGGVHGGGGFHGGGGRR
jgi:uncharacterized membrane protein YgcG